jgi:5-hydroxyisourate hydrolase
MATLSTHVLDTALGRPAVGVRIVLESDGGVPIGEGTTDADGRLPTLGSELGAGAYRLHFDTAAYYARSGVTGFYPEVVVTFSVSADEHYHVPLLLAPHGYATYRGS